MSGEYRFFGGPWHNTWIRLEDEKPNVRCSIWEPPETRLSFDTDVSLRQFKCFDYESLRLFNGTTVYVPVDMNIDEMRKPTRIKIDSYGYYDPRIRYRDAIDTLMQIAIKYNTEKGYSSE